MNADSVSFKDREFRITTSNPSWMAHPIHSLRNSLFPSQSEFASEEQSPQVNPTSSTTTENRSRILLRRMAARQESAWLARREATPETRRDFRTQQRSRWSKLAGTGVLHDAFTRLEYPRCRNKIIPDSVTICLAVAPNKETFAPNSRQNWATDGALSRLHTLHERPLRSPS